jgi:hypothetical protein
MAYDKTKPGDSGSLVAADVRENFRALEEEEFASTLATTGGQSILGGLLLKWGETTTVYGTGGEQRAVTFGTAFPNALLHVWVGLKGAKLNVTEGAPYVESVSPAPTRHGFTINKGTNGAAASHAVTMQWLAIGH